MTPFDSALSRTLSYEGWYSFASDDRGGETWRGIARRHWPQWAGWPIIDELKKNGMMDVGAAQRNEVLAEFVTNFYRDNFWIRSHCPLYDGRIAALVFDAAVNCGVRRAVRWLQRAINDCTGSKLAEDGVPGPATDAAAHCALAQPIINSITAYRCDFYTGLVVADASQRVFHFGWVTRACSYLTA